MSAVGVLGLLYKIYFGLVFYLTLILLFPLFFIFTRKEKWFPIVYKLKRFWAWLLLVLAFIRVRKVGKVPSTNKAFVMIANHSSYMDIVMMYRIFPQKFIFMGKKELLKWPLFNIFFKTMDIAVDRQNRVEAIKALKRAEIYLDKGYSIAIFPEGTIPKAAPQMKGLKAGAFKLAQDKNTGIQAVTFCNNFRLFSDPSQTFGRAHPGVATVIYHPFLSPEEVRQQDLLSLRQDWKDKMENPIKERYPNEFKS